MNGRRFGWRDGLALVQIIITTCTAGACALIVGIPVARVAFRHGWLAGVVVVVIVACVALAPLGQLLAYLPVRPHDGRR